MAVTKAASSGLLTGSKGSRLSSPAANAAAAAWVRPADWLTLPTVASGTQKLVGLVAVYPGDSNWVAVQCAGAYTVDWGDGTSPQNIATNTAVSHNFTYASVSGTDCTRGYRQSVVTITPQAGQSLTVVNLQPTRPTGMVSGWSSPWLDITMASSVLTSLLVSSAVTRAAMLERFEYVGSSSITSVGPAFTNARALQEVVGTTWTAGCTSLADMFNGCTYLTTIPLLSTAAGTNFNGMFAGCTALRTIPLLNTAAGTDLANMFGSCSALKTIPLLNTASGIYFNSMFSGCTALESVPLLNTANGATLSSMFATCTALQTVPLLNTAGCANFSSMFTGCNTLQSVPALNTAAGTNFATMFLNCMSLQSAPLAGTSKTISYASAKLKGSALDAIYTALASGVTAQTITVTSNWDVANDTPSIATAKGWTVTG